MANAPVIDIQRMTVYRGDARILTISRWRSKKVNMWRFSDRTAILVTHHLHEIPPEIERVIFMKDGRIDADGSKVDLLTDGQISALFDRPIVLARAKGWYQALPA